MNKPTRWSYSSISTYESCPAKWKYSYIDQLPYKPSAAMERGSRLHSDCEKFLKTSSHVLPWELAKMGPVLLDLKGKGAQSEETWCLDRYWLPDMVNPWIKAIVDVHWFESDGTVLQVRDFKSGREYPDHREQLELYALIGLASFPEVKRAEYGAIYLDTRHTSNEGAVLRGDMMDKKVNEWHDRAERMMADEQFLPTPGGACNWCDYSKKKGGPCQAG
jgi:hypothetical protein